MTPAWFTAPFRSVARADLRFDFTDSSKRFSFELRIPMSVLAGILITVGIGMHRNSFDAQLPAGTQNTQCNLTTISN